MTENEEIELARFARVPLEVEVELGRASASLRAILALEPGSILPIPKPAGEPFDLFAGGQHIALCEITAAADHRAARVTGFPDPQAEQPWK